MKVCPMFPFLQKQKLKYKKVKRSLLGNALCHRPSGNNTNVSTEQRERRKLG